MKWLFYAFVALVVAAVVIIVLKALLIIALLAALGYGVFWGIRYLATAKQRRRAALDARIEALERETGMK